MSVIDFPVGTSGSQTDAGDAAQHVRVAIVGTGFAGLGLAIRLKQAGIEDFVLIERADDVGGTWQANTYPGCQCDVPSHLYSFSFAPNPSWTRTYSRQPEIWDYLRERRRSPRPAPAHPLRPRADRRRHGTSSASAGASRRRAARGRRRSSSTRPAR